MGGLQTLMLGNDSDFLATRVSYKLDLRGPSVNVQTACSTSLVAVHVACQSLARRRVRHGAGRRRVGRGPGRAGYLYQDGGIVSPDGHCRAFDAQARGTVSGNGVGVVVLKRLDDALADGDTHPRGDPRHAPSTTTARDKVGFTAPERRGPGGGRSRCAQADRRASSPRTIGYVEAHGTGTAARRSDRDRRAHRGSSAAGPGARPFCASAR